MRLEMQGATANGARAIGRTKVEKKFWGTKSPSAREYRYIGPPLQVCC